MSFTDETMPRRVVRFAAATVVYGFAAWMMALPFTMLPVALWLYEWSVLFACAKEAVDTEKYAALRRWSVEPEGPS